MSIFFTAAAANVVENKRINAKFEDFQAGIDAISYYGGGAKQGDRFAKKIDFLNLNLKISKNYIERTMLDSIIPAVEAMKNDKDVVKAAREGANSTKYIDNTDFGLFQII